MYKVQPGVNYFAVLCRRNQTCQWHTWSMCSVYKEKKGNINYFCGKTLTLHSLQRSRWEPTHIKIHGKVNTFILCVQLNFGSPSTRWFHPDPNHRHFEMCLCMCSTRMYFLKIKKVWGVNSFFLDMLLPTYYFWKIMQIP